MIFSLRARGHVNRVVSTRFHTTQRVSSALALLTPESIIFHAGKNLITYEIISYVRVAEWPLDGRWMAVRWKYLYSSSVGLHIVALIPIRQYFSWFYFLRSEWNIESVNLPDEVVNLWIFTVGLTLSGCQPHTSSVWPWSGTPKVRLYGTFMSGLRHSPPRMKNQHGSMRKETL